MLHYIVWQEIVNKVDLRGLGIVVIAVLLLLSTFHARAYASIDNLGIPSSFIEKLQSASQNILGLQQEKSENPVTNNTSVLAITTTASPSPSQVITNFFS